MPKIRVHISEFSIVRPSEFYRPERPASANGAQGHTTDAPEYPVAPQFWNIPNLLSLSRLPLAVLLCICISFEWWCIGLITFSLAAASDWLDGWWARRFGQLTPFGRSLDPLTDKVLIGAAFIFLIPVPNIQIYPWVVTVVIGRELLITGLRGMIEATGKSFGADWFGKLKTVLQCIVLITVLLLLELRLHASFAAVISALEWIYFVLLYAMLTTTVGSAILYGIKAVRMLR
jgi:CDP-diacylglycerol---glycerol-3-phosphate 3-phosphatidyltransferase